MFIWYVVFNIILVFNLKIHQNNIYFLFLKFIFDINKSKQSKNIKKFIIFKKT